MDDRLWQEVKRVLDEALRRAPEVRSSFVEDACSGDEALRGEVDSLLAFHDETRDLLGRPVFDVNAEDPRVGQRIGPYRIARLLGRGGMGKVYLAIREDDYSKQVAVKLIQQGLDAAARIERFHEERQILAGLDHPAIARLLDGGTTEDGLPYLVMELVEGEPIDRFCDARRLDVRQRLELFRQVLEAVDFSHRHLVVHRDLKPGNIMVSAEGSVKLIDFGIAKLLRDAPQGAEPRPRPMSPRYASPEQIRGGSITTATDVFSLGVLLYELLAGRHPYRGEIPEEDLAHAICETTPPVPSAVAQDSSTARRLAGDLDAMLMKAMRKRPEERYASAAQFADDVDRYLSGRPVLARPSTVSYRAFKFLRRHRLPFAAVVLALLALASTFATLGLRFSVARQRAQIKALETFVSNLFRAAGPDRAGGEDPAVRELLDLGRDTLVPRSSEETAATETFVTDLLRDAGSDHADGKDLTVRDLLDRGRDELGAGLERHPLVRAGLLGVVGRVYKDLGELDDAERMLAAALELQRLHDPGDNAAMARRENDLGLVLRRKGRLQEAEALYRSALGRLGGCRSKNADSVWIAGNLAWVRALRNDFAEAETLIECLRERKSSDPSALADVLNKLGGLRYQKERFEEAEEAFREALALREEYFGPHHTKVANVHNNLGAVLLARGELSEAEDELRKALEIRRSLLVEDHRDIANTEKNLAQVLMARGDPAAAEPLIRHAVEVLRSKPGEERRVAEAQSVLGECLTALGRCAEAKPLLAGSDQILERGAGGGAREIHASREIRAARERLNRWEQHCGSPGDAAGAPDSGSGRR